MSLLTDIASQLGWVEGAGECVGHWFVLPPGHKCLWSVRWCTSNGVIKPGDFVDLNAMDVTQCLAELADLAARSYANDDKTGTKANEFYSLVSTIEAITPGCVDWLSQKRGQYPEYDAPWSLPGANLIPTADVGEPGHQILVRDLTRTELKRPGWQSDREPGGPLWIYHD